MTLIAIDGPSGSGKSTLARALATRLGLSRLDTGAMYRAVALLAARLPSEANNECHLGHIARTMQLEMGDRIVADGEDVTGAIRSNEVTKHVSAVAALPAVRAALVERQRNWAREHNGGVVEGRDIGSVVFPDADVKVFLTADLSERGRRRTAELRSEGIVAGADEASVTDEIIERDDLDSHRAMSPLVVPDGALVIDSTGREADDIVEQIVRLL